jgi:hypothetical protein
VQTRPLSFLFCFFLFLFLANANLGLKLLGPIWRRTADSLCAQASGAGRSLDAGAGRQTVSAPRRPERIALACFFDFFFWMLAIGFGQLPVQEKDHTDRGATPTLVAFFFNSDRI